MKKILLAFDGKHFSEGALRFARQLNIKRKILLTGVFLPQIDYANLWSYAESKMTAANFIPLLEDEDSEVIRENIKKFEAFCREYNIDYLVHKDFDNLALPELKKETRYADLLLLSSEKFFEQAGSHLNDYLKEALHDVECPVIVLPENYDFPTTNILSYDGSESSVYALKQFAYLFPELVNNETILVYAGKEVEEEIPEKSNIEEWASRHFLNLDLLRLKVSPKKYFSSWVANKKASIVVCGAFGRSGISRMFKKSFVSDVIIDHRLPLFIAHK